MVANVTGLVQHFTALAFIPVIRPHDCFLSACRPRASVVCSLNCGHEEAFVDVPDVAFPDWFVRYAFHKSLDLIADEHSDADRDDGCEDGEFDGH